MIDDPLAGGTGGGTGGSSTGTAASEDVRGPKKISCKFCDCVLTPQGDYFQMSERAKAYRDALDENVKLKSELTDARAKLEIFTKKPETPERPKGFLY
jgi:hypothetical protein